MDTGFLRELQLKPERIMRDLEVSSGLASAYLRRIKDSPEDETNTLLVAATYYRRAAANALLLGRYAIAKGLFLEATKSYLRLRLPYSVVVAALAGASNLEVSTRNWFGTNADHEVAERTVPQLAYVALARLTTVESGQIPRVLISDRRSLDPYRLRPLGVLGVPVGAFLDLFDSLVPDTGERRIDLAEALSPVFGAYNAAIRQTIQNHYHWERLALPFHPADPDIYSVLAITNSALRIHRQVRLQRFIDRATISTESKYLLSTILEGMAGDQEDMYLRM